MLIGQRKENTYTVSYNHRRSRLVIMLILHFGNTDNKPLAVCVANANY